MKKLGHFVFGLFLSFAFVLLLGYLKLDWFVFDFKSVSFIISLTLFYSILPDIDHKSSTMTWFFIALSMLGMLLGIFELIFNFGKPLFLLILSLSFLFLIFVATTFFRHRGFMHSIVAGILLVLPLWFIFGSFSYCLMAFVAWYSHLLGDGFLFKWK